MAYLGGKSKSAEHILDVLNNSIFDDYDYIEPFCGYCHILRRVINKKTYTISDNNELLIVLLKHIQQNKGKHETVNKEEYLELRKNPKSNILKAAYAAFCYSYNGKYFGGYVDKYKDRDYPNERKAYYDLLHDNETFKMSKIHHTDYNKYSNVKGKLIYCDPPYENTTEYHSAFDSTKFWNFIRKLSRYNYVFVSEYAAPDDFISIREKNKKSSVSGRGATMKRREKLYVHRSRISDAHIKKILTKNKTFNKTLKKNKKNLF